LSSILTGPEEPIDNRPVEVVDNGAPLVRVYELGSSWLARDGGGLKLGRLRDGARGGAAGRWAKGDGDWVAKALRAADMAAVDATGPLESGEGL
jgi:hypothetical protein